ncbi:MAG: MFS transporter [Bacteroidota bacterium]
MKFRFRIRSGAPPLDRVYMFLFSLRFSEAFWVIYLRSKGMSFAVIGLLETVFHLVSLAGEVPTGWIADRFGRKASLIAGRVLSILAALLALQASNAAGLAVAFSFSALSYTCHSGAFDALVYEDRGA